MLAPFCRDEHAQTHAKTCLFKTNNNLNQNLMIAKIVFVITLTKKCFVTSLPVSSSFLAQNVDANKITSYLRKIKMRMYVCLSGCLEK